MEPPFRRSESRTLNFFYRIRLVFFLRRSVKKACPDVVLSMSDTFNYLVIASLLKLDCKVFIGDVTKPDRKLALATRLGKKIFYPLASGFIAQTKQAAEFYQRKFNGKLNLRVINGAVKAIEKHSVERKHLILCAGRLSFEKGQDRLIEAFALIENKDDWKVVLTADGPFKSQLKKLVQEKSLTEKVIFTGKVDDIDLLYSESSLFVLPSRIEGFPNALTEAMAAGLPCICFDSFPADEIIVHGEDGFILKDGDVIALSEMMRSLMADPGLRKAVGDKAERISGRLSGENIGNQVLKFMFP